MSNTEQPQTLDPVQAGEGEAEGKRWAYWLVVFLRVMAGISLMKGLYHWAIVCGIEAHVCVSQTVHAGGVYCSVEGASSASRTAVASRASQARRRANASASPGA